MIVLDTNVLSALMRKGPEPKVIEWLDGQPRSSVWTTAISVLEIRFGLQTMSLGKKRASLIKALERLLSAKIERRVAPFDVLAAQEAANLMAMRKVAGHPGDLRDTMIAGIVVAARATLATHNTRHFSDLPVPVVDPWESSEK